MNYFYRQLANSYKERNIQFLRGGNKIQKIVADIKHGSTCKTEHCAQYQNEILRKSGYNVRGNAWNLSGTKPVYSGYDVSKRPKEYSRKAVEQYNREAADNVLRNFKSASLDTTKTYVTPMYYKGSPYQEEAFRDAKDNLANTHTGFLVWRGTTPEKRGEWELIHNIGKKVYKRPFVREQGGGKQYGPVAIYEALPKERETSLVSRIIDRMLGRAKGGKIEIKPENRGKFTDYCGGKVTQDCITKGKNSKDPKIRKRATFADNARKWKKLEGGLLQWIS